MKKGKWILVLGALVVALVVLFSVASAAFDDNAAPATNHGDYVLQVVAMRWVSPQMAGVEDSNDDPLSLRPGIG
jgi:hypothetical protein